MKIIEKFKYHKRLKEVLDAKRKKSEEYDAVASSLKYPGEDQGHLSSLAQEERELDCCIDLLKTEYFKRLTEKLIIPMPELSDEKLYYKFDFDDEYGDRYLLTTKGFHQVLDSVRNEEKRRREIIISWLTIAIGLIGAITGLVSIIKF